MSHANNHEVHISGYGSNICVFLGLVVLTGFTVAAAGVNLGSLNLLIAMGIATLKASLVLSYFMHIKFEKPGLQFIVIGVILFMIVVFAETFLDFATR
jgi:cytochrome c oxidase subunit IV